MEKKQILGLITGILMLSILIVSIGLYYTDTHSKDVHDRVTLSVLGKNTKEKDVDIDFSDSLTTSNNITDYSLKEFHEILQENFEYTPKKDIEYWALIWSLYGSTNPNLSWNYLEINNSMIVVFSNKTDYCIAQLNKIDCNKNIAENKIETNILGGMI